jgi:hypothetical protein
LPKITFPMDLHESDDGSISMATSSDLAYTEEDAVVNEFDSLGFKRTKEMEEEYIRIQIRTREKLSPDDYQKLAYLSRVLGSEKVTRLDQTDGPRASRAQHQMDEEQRENMENYTSRGYDNLSGNLTEEQEAEDAQLCMDTALLIFGPAVLGRQDEYEYRSGSHLDTTNHSEEEEEGEEGEEEEEEEEEEEIEEEEEEVDESVKFDLTHQEGYELIDNFFDDSLPQPAVGGAENPNGNPADGNLTSIPLGISVTGSEYDMTAELENPEDNKVLSSQPTTAERGTLTRSKTAKKVFAAVEQRASRNLRSPSKTTPRPPRSADWSWGDSQPKLAPAPSPRNNFGGGSIHSAEVKELITSGELTRPSSHKAHQRNKSNPRNSLTSANPVPSSRLSSARAGSPSYKQPEARDQAVRQVGSLFGLPSTRNTVQAPTTPKKQIMQSSQGNYSGDSANNSGKTTPMSENTQDSSATPIRKSLLPPAPPSLPRRPPGPLPSFSTASPVPKPNFEPKSPAIPGGNLREFAVIKFSTWVGREQGVKLWDGIENSQLEKFRDWRAAHPRYKEMHVVPDFAPESTTLELCGPVGSNVRGALHELFNKKYDAKARLDEL